MIILTIFYIVFSRPRRRRKNTLEKLHLASQSLDQLTSSSNTAYAVSPEPNLLSLPERLSESEHNLDSLERSSRRCRSCDGILDADENAHENRYLPAPLEAATQTKRKKNFMDRCVNKVRLWRVIVITITIHKCLQCVFAGDTTVLFGLINHIIFCVFYV